MSHTYDELKHKTIAELREIAKGIDHEAVKGYTQMNKDHLVPAICAALGIDAHHHHHSHHAPIEGFDKSKAKAALRALKADRDKAQAAGDHARLKQIRRQRHALTRRIRANA